MNKPRFYEKCKPIQQTRLGQLVHGKKFVKERIGKYLDNVIKKGTYNVNRYFS